MDPAEQRKKHILWSIQQNPTVITIKRTEKVRSGGGFTDQVSEVGPLTVRIFAQPTGGRHEISDVAGRKQTDTAYGMLADDTADIKAGPNVRDEFEAPGLGVFVIRAVYPQVVAGVVAGFQAELERVK